MQLVIMNPEVHQVFNLRLMHSWIHDILIDVHAPFWHGCLTNVNAVDFQTTRLQKFCQNSDHVRAREYILRVTCERGVYH